MTNRDFLLAVLEHEIFRNGEVDTAFLDQHLSREARSRPASSELVTLHAIAATLHLFHERRQTRGPIPVGIPSGWRNNRWRPQEQVFEHAGERLAVRYVTGRDDHFSIDFVHPDGTEQEPQSFTARLVEAGDGLVIAEIDGVRRRFRLGRLGSRLAVHGLGRVSDLTIVPRFPERRAADVAGGCAAPMTGKVLQVLVTEGEHVKAGDALVVLEAMKMEHQLQSHADGVVESVRVEAGQMVDPDEVLVVVTPHAEEEDGG